MPVTKQDQQFMQTAATDGMKEVEMGRMAQQHGQSAAVKRLGQMMVTDHTSANTRLLAVAQKHAVKVNTKAPAAANMPSGGNFDQQWLSEMLPAHQRAISLFQTEAKQGSNTEITGFATTTLPTLEKHLRELQAAQGKSGSKTESNANGWRRKNL
jgi:putative membrane protein